MNGRKKHRLDKIACQSHTKYSTEDEAEKKMALCKRNHPEMYIGKHYTVFSCRICGGWHFGRLKQHIVREIEMRKAN